MRKRILTERTAAPRRREEIRVLKSVVEADLRKEEVEEPPNAVTFGQIQVRRTLFTEEVA